MNNYAFKLGQGLVGLMVTIGFGIGLVPENKTTAVAAPMVSENLTVQASPIPLQGTSWVLVDWTDQNNGNFSAEMSEPITLNFLDGQVNGSSSCNRYMASYKIEGDQLQITPTATTTRACMEEIMRQESTFIKALAGVQQYEVSDRGLQISYTTEEGSGTMTFAPQPTAELNNKTWVLVSLEEGTNSKAPLKGTEITVNFTEDQVAGFGSCNQYMTTYTREGNQLSISELATTRKACPQEIMRQEFEYLSALQAAQWYEINPQGQLKISYKAPRGTGTITFVPQAETSLTDTTWMLTSWDDPAVENMPPEAAKITAIFAGDRLSGQSGCNNYTGSYTTEGTMLKVDTLASTKMACPPAIMELESQYLSALEGADRYEINAQNQLQIFYNTKRGSGSMTFQSEQVKPMSLTTEERVVYVDSKSVACTGVGPQQCLQVRENPEEEWILFYDTIKGFDYEPGYQYKIRVAETIADNPPADASLFQWSLIEVLSKTAEN